MNRTWRVPRHGPLKVRWIFRESGRTDGADSEALNVERTPRILRLRPVPLLLLPLLLQLEAEAQHRRPRLRKRPDAAPEVNVEAAASEAALHCRQTAFPSRRSAMSAAACRETSPSSRGRKS